MQAIPSIAWLPLTVLWMGLSEASIITIVFLGAVWSIVVNTQAGIRNVPPLWIRAARTMGAKGSRLFTAVVLPAALPQMLSGWRLAWAFSWRSLMAGELLSPGRGLGEVLIVSRNVNDMAAVLAVIVIIGVFGSLVDNLLFQRAEEQTRRKWGLAPA
jgi:NitT/TauT family transport system permease protein